jgi:hypothetical protein
MVPGAPGLRPERGPFASTGTTAAGRPAHRRLIADELTKLAALRDAGVLTDEEFDNQKARLLG